MGPLALCYSQEVVAPGEAPEAGTCRPLLASGLLAQPEGCRDDEHSSCSVNFRTSELEP